MPEQEPNLNPPLDPDAQPAELTDTVVRGAGLASAGYLLAQALTLIAYMVLARLLSPGEFGEYAEATVLISVAILFTESGMMAALIHRKDRIDAAASTATVATAVSGLGFSLLALAAAPLLGAFFDSDTVTEVAAASSGLLFLRSLRVVPEAMLQRRFSFLRRVIIEPIGVVVFGVTAVIASSNGMGIWSLVVGYYASAAADAILSWALLGWRPRLRSASFQMWKELISYGRHIVATVALHRAEQQLPIVLLGRFIGAGAVGQFRFAARMEGTAGNVVVQAGAYVLFPALARITEDRDRFRDACLRSLRLMSTIGLPLGLLLLPLGVPAAVLAFGREYEDAGYAAMALAGMPAAGTLVSFASETLKADGRPDILARIRTVLLIATLAFSVALLPFGLVGVAAGLSLGTIAGMLYGMNRAGHQLGLTGRQMVGEVLPPALAALTMAGVLTALEFLVIDAHSRSDPVLGGLLVAEGLLAIVVYLLVLRILSPQGFRELISLVGRMFRRRRRTPEAGAVA